MLPASDSLAAALLDLHEDEQAAIRRCDAAMDESLELATQSAELSADREAAAKGIRHVVRQNNRLRRCLRAALRYIGDFQ